MDNSRFDSIDWPVYLMLALCAESTMKAPIVWVIPKKWFHCLTYYIVDSMISIFVDDICSLTKKLYTLRNCSVKFGYYSSLYSQTEKCTPQKCNVWVLLQWSYFFLLPYPDAAWKLVSKKLISFSCKEVACSLRLGSYHAIIKFHMALSSQRFQRRFWCNLSMMKKCPIGNDIRTKSWRKQSVATWSLRSEYICNLYGPLHFKITANT